MAKEAVKSVTKVEAIRIGFFGGQRRQVGDQFDVPVGTIVSDRWMKVIGKGKVAKPAKPAESSSKDPDTLSEAQSSQEPMPSDGEGSVGDQTVI